MITDHNGADWTPTNGLTLTGIHTNVNLFTITSGYTCNIATGVPFEVYAVESIISGTIDGDGRGYPGGYINNNGAGPGGGIQGMTNIAGSGGGGYGGAGGNGQNDYAGVGTGGSSYGLSDEYIIQRGSGGGGGSSGGGWATRGGTGGGSILICSNKITITGIIKCNGINAESDTGGAGGGGAGGGILLIANDLDVMNAILRCLGGSGGNGGGTSDGGGGAGGRIKGLCSHLVGNLTSQSLVTAGSGGPSGDAGSVGTIHSNSYLGRCDFAHTVGQTINFKIPGNVILSSMILKTSFLTSGTCTITVYDSPDKNINYGSVAITGSTGGEHTWDFSPDIRLVDGMLDYYFELTTSTADMLLSYSCFDSYENGTLYTDDESVHGVDLYMKIYSIAHVTNPAVYNVSNRDIKCEFGKLLTGAVHRINADGTGTIEYEDLFNDQKYVGDSADYTNATYNPVTNGIDFTSDGYLYYKYDTKHPIESIPILSADIFIASGTPKIQIAEDNNGEPGSWYDIKDAVAHNITTDYELDSEDLSLVGKTCIYFRFDFLSSTGTLDDFKLNVDTKTDTAQTPVIDTGGSPNTFKCDQDPASSIDGTVTLYYNDAKYAG